MVNRLVFAAVSAPLLVAAAPKEPLVLSPTSAWVLNYADDSCQLLRTFGEGDDKVSLVFERASPRSLMTMTVIGEPFETVNSDADFLATFRPHEDVKAMGGQPAKSAAKKISAVLWTHVSFRPWQGDEIVMLSRAPDLQSLRKAKHAVPEEEDAPKPVDVEKRRAAKAEALAAADTVKTIEISRKGGRTVVLQTGTMGKVNRAIDQCADQLLEAWGVDPKVEEKIAFPVVAPNVMSWFNSNDYPMEMLQARQESYLNVRLLISTDGKVTKCTPVTPMAAKAFATKVCDVLGHRAKFRPAKLADGTPVASYYMQGIQFRMPN